MKTYTSFRALSAEFDHEARRFTLRFAGHDGFFTFGVDSALFHGETAFTINDYPRFSAGTRSLFDSQELTAAFSGGPAGQETLTVTVRLSKEGAKVSLGVMGHYRVRITGEMSFGKNSGRPVRLDRRGLDLRAALGPYASTVDNALFDTETDAAIEVTGPSLNMKYNWQRKCFSFGMLTAGDDVQRDFSLRVREKLMETRFGVPYAPMNHDTCFPSPPVGWMTWYAVQFDACEDTVLENARFQKEHLAPYGANAIWVDWEWYHSDFSGENAPGIDVFHPDPRRYPRGLKYLADEIASLGFIPALWIGASNDPNENEFLKAHPDALLVRKKGWCGQYFLDPTHPAVPGEYIPRVFRGITDAGYRAIKWDCLPITFSRVDENHDSLYDPSLSTDEAMRGMVRAARECTGRNIYLLSCSGETQRDIFFAGDLFDAARVGGDIFRWSEFVTSGVERVVRLYQFHNTLLYTDPDNVVIREKYNTFDQAVSRVSVVSLLGLPFTFGDRFGDLDDERLYLLQHAIPVPDIHPMDIRDNPSDGRTLLINTGIATEWEDWNVIDVFNLTEEDSTVTIELGGDLHLPCGEYLLFDYWDRRFLGTADGSFTVQLRPCESRVISVRKKTGAPQILSTTRHVTQGVIDLTDVHWDGGKGILSGTSDIVEGDDYSLFLYIPAGYRVIRDDAHPAATKLRPADGRGESERPGGAVWQFALPSGKNGKVHWSVAFTGPHQK